jgi:hypothetical protein
VRSVPRPRLLGLISVGKMVKPSSATGGSASSLGTAPRGEVELDVGRLESLARSDEGASLGKGGGEWSPPPALEEREVLGRHRGAQALIVGEPDERDVGMVLEVVPDRQLGPRLDPQRPQLIGGAEAGEQQQLGRVVGARADDDLALAPDLLQLVVSQHLDADRAPALEQDLGGEGIGEHLHVSPLERRTQVRDRRAAAPAVSLGELKPARSFLGRAVVIIARPDPGVHGRIDAGPNEPMHRAALAHRERSADAVVIALAALVVSERLKYGSTSWYPQPPRPMAAHSS